MCVCVCVLSFQEEARTRGFLIIFWMMHYVCLCKEEVPRNDLPQIGKLIIDELEVTTPIE